MEGGTVTNGTAVDLQLAEAYRSSGGFAGEMLTGSVANTGNVSLAGLKIIGADSLAALKTFGAGCKTVSCGRLSFRSKD